MDMPYYRPSLYARRITNRPEMCGGQNGYHDVGNTFLAHNFVVLTSNALVAVASAGVLSCGLVLDASKTGSTDVVNPPYDMFGDRHFPVLLEGQRFAISVTDATGNYGQANGAPQMSELAVGTSYGIIKLANGTHALNVDNVSQLFFTVVEKPDVFNGVKQTSATYNPVVIVEVIAACVQKVG